MKKSSLTLALFLAVLLPLGAAGVVSRILVVESGDTANPSSLEQVVLSNIGTQVGKEYSPVQLSKDVSGLTKLGGIDDAQTKAVTLEDGSIQVTFTITLRKRIAEIRFRGNVEFKDKALKSHMQSQVGEHLDDVKLAADRKRILEKYEKDGFYGTFVTQEIVPLEDNPEQAVLTFVIQETRRAKLKGTAFQGNTAFTESEISRVLFTKRQWWRYIIRFGNYYNPSLQNADIEKILELYGTKGYLDAQVTNVELSYEDEMSWVLPTYVIHEGAVYTLGKRSFQGNQKFSEDELLAKVLLQTGDVYDTEKADADLQAMKALYEEKGYLDLRFYPQLTKNPDNHTVDVTYMITEGEPSRIGQITILGNTYTRDHVIRRELAIFEDDLADQRKIRQTKNRLENLGYFESVEVLAKPTDNPTRRDLSIELSEKPTGAISLGGAYSTDDSLVGFLELTEKNFSTDKLLDMEKPKGDGQRMRAYIALGSSTANISLSLTEPALFDSPFELTNELFINKRYEDEYDERHIGYAVGLSWPVAFQLPFLDDHTEYWRLSTGLRLEQIKINNVDDEEKFDEDDGKYPDHVEFPEGKNYSIYERDNGSEFTNRLLLSAVRDTRNHYIFPNRGSRAIADIEYVTKALGSYADYMKFHAGIESYLPCYGDAFLRLAANAYTAEHFSGDDIKIFDRYFAGGYGTIRGFKRHDVSPVNRNENSIGGQTMLVGTVEVIKPVLDFIFLKAFCDAGNVWWDSFDADLGEINASLGVGVQFKTVPIRLDYGIPVVTEGEHLDGKSGRIHFSIDYSF